MSDREPQEMAQVAAATGAKKAHRSWDRVLVSAFLAGAYISFGGLVAITVSSGLDPANWARCRPCSSGGVHLGLVLVLIAGSDLRPANDAGPAERDARQDRVGDVARNLPAGAHRQPARGAFVAYFLAVQTGGSGTRGSTGTAGDLRAAGGDRLGQGDPCSSHWQVFLRGIGCNWLVCSVWMSLAAKNVPPARSWPSLSDHGLRGHGLRPRRGQHVLPPAAIFAGVPDLTWGDALLNWLFAGVGTWSARSSSCRRPTRYLFLRDQPDRAGRRGTRGARLTLAERVQRAPFPAQERCVSAPGRQR